MANLRDFKKEIDYRLEEFVFDCDMAIYFQPSKEEAIFALMQKGVELRNELYVKANNPAEPHNKSLVRKHFSALREEMIASFNKLFEELSANNAEGGFIQKSGLFDKGCRTDLIFFVQYQKRSSR